MSFKCGICHETSKPGESATRIVTETRTKQYPLRENAFGLGKHDRGGVGTETVKEVLACSVCVTLHQKQKGEQ